MKTCLGGARAAGLLVLLGPFSCTESLDGPGRRGAGDGAVDAAVDGTPSTAGDALANAAPDATHHGDAALDSGPTTDAHLPLDSRPEAAHARDAAPDAEGGAAVVRRSCVGLPSACGSAGTEVCCRASVVPGGAFPMGRSLQGQDATTPGDDPLQHEVPEHTVQISAFELDEFEVTVGRFRRFVDAYEREGIPAPGAGSHRNIVDSGFPASGVAALPSTRAALVQRLHPQSTWTQTEASTETLPITGLDWYVAFAFCIWDGGRLPTESEWERAAAGGEDNRLYPWGSSYPDPRAADRAVYSSDRPQAVGMMLKGVGRYGHRDLAGNAAEWVLDTYDAKRYASVPPNCADCANLAWTLPTTHAARVMRGGHYNSVSSEIRAASRASLGANGAMIGVGMRCAR